MLHQATIHPLVHTDPAHTHIHGLHLHKNHDMVRGTHLRTQTPHTHIHVQLHLCKLVTWCCEDAMPANLVWLNHPPTRLAHKHIQAYASRSATATALKILQAATTTATATPMPTATATATLKPAYKSDTPAGRQRGRPAAASWPQSAPDLHPANLLRLASAPAAAAAAPGAAAATSC